MHDLGPGALTDNPAVEPRNIGLCDFATGAISAQSDPRGLFRTLLGLATLVRWFDTGHLPQVSAPEARMEEIAA